MKKIMLIAALGILAHVCETHAQEPQKKDQDKTEMQQNDASKNKKSDSNRKMDRKKKDKDDKDHKQDMDQYPSNKQQGTSPTEQRHMDTTMNNHR